MITGVVTADREAVIGLAVRGPTGQEQQIEAVVDTGFDGWFSLPPAARLAEKRDMRESLFAPGLDEIRRVLAHDAP